ncbi:MAG: hypothetical protein WDN06_10975 [Asticcacaulis sp.]
MAVDAGQAFALAKNNPAGGLAFAGGFGYIPARTQNEATRPASQC